MNSPSTESRPQGCEFLFRTPESIFIPEHFSADEQLMIAAADQFSRGQVLPNVESLEKQADGLMPRLIRSAGELGFCGIDAPEAYGGLGLGKNVAARILERLSADASFSVTIGVTSGIAQVGLNWFGTEAQKSKYLPKLTSGEWLGAYCLSEPNSGSDALSVATRARREGDNYIVDGTKMWISNAKWAEFFVVFAKVDGERFSAFLVERGFPGVHIEREEHKLGLKGSSTARVVLEGCVVPAENLLHIEGLGHQVAFNSLNLGRFKLASMSIGPLRHAIECAASYAKDRRQFGEPICNFGLIRRKFELAAMLYWISESVIYRTGALIDQAFEELGGSPEGNRKAAEAYAVECAICKVFATEAEAIGVDEMLQVYGGYGFTEEFPLARHYRDARVSRIYEGSNEINRFFIGSRLVRHAQGAAVPTRAQGDSFIGDLALRALRYEPSDQIALGALADLAILRYAEQAALARSNETGDWGRAAFHSFLRWAQPKAAACFQAISNESVTLPAPPGGDSDTIPFGVLEGGFLS